MLLDSSLLFISRIFSEGRASTIIHLIDISDINWGVHKCGTGVTVSNGSGLEVVGLGGDRKRDCCCQARILRRLLQQKMSDVKSDDRG